MLMIVKYPPSREISKRKLEMVKEGDVVILIQDAVLYALGNENIKALKDKGVKIYALKEDFECRGYSEEESVVDFIDYEKFIDIVVEDGEKVIG